MNESTSLAESQLSDPHYLRSVTQMGDARPVVANRDILAASGMKLISAGMRIDSSLYERLLQHKLVPPLDESLSTEDAVTRASLAESAERMMQQDTRLALIQGSQLDGVTLPLVLKQLPLNPAIAFKLTVMRETKADLFQRSLYVALVSAYIGMQLQMNKNQLVDLATGALLHDIGMLHVDPRLLEGDYKMTEAERRHLYVHTVTGGMILKAYPEYRQKVVDAVLQHHERLDGSGYPRGLKAGELGQFGRIIGIAEVVASRSATGEVGGGSKLETMLKLNQRRYGGDLVPFLKVFYREESEVPFCSEIDKQLAQEKMAQIAAVFSAWEKARSGFDSSDLTCAFASERMLNLKMEIVDAGLNLDMNGEDWIGFDEDARACFDARLLLDETLWQLHSILQEIKRRCPAVAVEDPVPAAHPLSAWVREVEALL
ncbi:hypothetical protein MIZ01_0393 [Sideroxyarcus emersonii]|uniref:HD-GYP domain-containing protein n=1 Tax=Sideroxyarcus emersonii TaxID=2764705 RepID=A0AAN1X8F7_9PROT|nr:HD domain-containing phosphohydrolase [Sideroxyarcus emersonii]BCK86629.1 hypothetical protein MIZ01_0393 [Sideroxyarcus emersonii]